MSHHAPWEADPYMAEPDGRSRSQEGDQEPGCVTELLMQLLLLTAYPDDTQG